MLATARPLGRGPRCHRYVSETRNMLSPIEEQVVQAGLVDIDGTFLIQLAVFLLFFAR